MKTKLLLIFVFFSVYSFAQDKYYTKSGTISFEASVPAFEEVKATNNKVTAIFKPKTGDIAVLALVKGFRFKVALMEEHFNENYAESDKFPKTTFSGKIQNYNSNILEGNNKVTIKGKLTFHGITNEVEVPGAILKNGKTIKLNVSFSLKPEDYHINIPKLIRKKVAETIDIKIDFDLLKK